MRTHVIPFLIDSGRIDTTLEMYNGMEGHGRVNLKVIRLINRGRRDTEKRWVKPSDRQKWFSNISPNGEVCTVYGGHSDEGAADSDG